MEDASILCHFVRHGGAYNVLLTWLFQQADKCQAAIVILSNACRAWTLYLWMDSLKFILDVPGASIL